MKRKVVVFFLVFLFFSLAGSSAKRITVEEIYREYKFLQNSFDEVFPSEKSAHFFTLKNNKNIVKYSYKTGKIVETIFNVDHVSIPGVFYVYEFNLHEKENKILFSTNVEKLYRYSYFADYYIFDINTGKFEPVAEDIKIRDATFSPDGKKVAYVHENNLFIKDLKTSIVKKVTNDGVKNQVINGVPDWVYEEEFSYHRAYEWSPGSNKIAFCKFDESHVKEYHLKIYNELYPKIYSYKYPKAGEKNSKVSVHIYNLETDVQKKVYLGDETDQYIPRIKWVNQTGDLAIYRLNRLQNEFELLLANEVTGETRSVYKESNKWYISDMYDHLVTFTGDKFILT
ncbi:MAG: DPP IV N-terminal domain-containing protein, partial [Bacteroidota bacterium]